MGGGMSLRDDFRPDAAGCVAVYRFDRDLAVTAANDTFLEWLGLRGSDVIGRSIAELASGPWAAIAVRLHRKLVEDPEVEVHFGELDFAPEGVPTRRVRFLLYGERGEDGTCTEFLGVAIDLDGVGSLEVAPTLSSEAAAAGRIARAAGLGPRHRELLLLLATGHRVPHIAEVLFLARGTVRNRIVALGDALGVRGQGEIVRLVRSEVSAARAGAPQPGNVSPR